MILIRTILQPTDFSEHAKYALEVACAIARDQDARVVLLHVVPPTGPFPGPAMSPDRYRLEHTEEDLRGYRAEMDSRLDRLRKAAPLVRAEGLLKEGDVVDTILRTAEELPCDLVVMGSHGRTGQTETLLGSTAEALSRRAPCPVLTVKMPAEHPLLFGETESEPASASTGRA
jgi:universal stress protein A